jgi:hypothetical protein
MWQLRAIAPAQADRLVDLLIAFLQCIVDGLTELLGVASTLLRLWPARQRPRRARGSRPPRPTTVGLVFAEPTPQEVSVQRAANLAVW